ncbi:MAG: peptide-binding protein [Planctomycetales bacterium]|nr:peptide-binding protein [Planctomycetales bacterium]
MTTPAPPSFVLVKFHRGGRLRRLGTFALDVSATSRLVLLLVVIVTLAGCSAPPNEGAPVGTTDTAAVSATTESAGVASEESDTLIEPFDPPTLAELDAKVEWIDQPVVDALKELREYQATWPPAENVDTVLALRNNSEEANARILNTLGRLPTSDSDVNYDATFLRRLRGDVNSTNPILINSTEEFDVSGFISAGLFSFDWNMKPFATADTVKSWQTSRDGMYDKVVLRDDLTWSDGKPLTARDVVFSFRTIMNPKVPVPAVRSGTDKLRWVEAYDDYTLVYFQKAAEATNVWNINFPIIPEHVYKDSLREDPTLQNSRYHVNLEDAPVTGGPYKFVSRTRGQDILLERREDYYMHDGKQVRDKPYFKYVRFRVLPEAESALLALEQGTIEEMELTPEQWVTRTDDDTFYELNTKVRGVQWLYYYFGWNMATPFFEDVRVREAMSYAFDHEEMLETLHYGLNEPAAGMFYPGSWMAPKEPLAPYRQDLDKAEQLLDEAGWVDTDGDGIRDKEIGGRRVPFEFNIVVKTDPVRVAICELLRQNLDQIGVVCNIQPLESTVLLQRMNDRKYQACFAGWGTGTDPYTNENLWKTGEERNYSGYSNPEVDRLFDEARGEFDREKRGALYARIGEIIYQDQPYTFLYFQSAFYGFNKGLRGYMFSPRGPYHFAPGISAIWATAD